MIAIVDYGAGNLRSIQRAIEAGEASVEITADLPKKVEWDQAKLTQLIARIRAAGDLWRRPSRSRSGSTAHGRRRSATASRLPAP